MDEWVARFGVILKPMNQENLELVRQKRNLPEIRRWMTTDHEISEMEMFQWYHSLPKDCHYWMVEWRGRLVGQVNLKGLPDACADPGFLFWDDAFSKEGGVPRAILALYDYAFSDLGIRMLKGITACDNRRALRLARGMGFSESGSRLINGKMFVEFQMERSGFEETQMRFMELFLGDQE